MRTIFSLIMAALIVNACIRAGDSAWRHYQLEDAIDQETRFGSSKTTSELRRRIADLAVEYGVPLTAEDVVVERRGQHTFVSLEYLEDIPLVPKAYTHQKLYDITMSVQPMRALVVDDRK